MVAFDYCSRMEGIDTKNVFSWRDKDRDEKKYVLDIVLE
jgi:hypothetical protein